jgi:hypothetical protein
VLSELLIPVSAGELLDKKTILEIKRERLKDDGQRANVERELALLSAIARERLDGPEFAGALAQLESELRAINETLWDLENTVRAFERSGDFSGEFIDAARSIYAGNDRRASVKRKINLLLGSQLIEEKSHGR